MGRSRKKQPVEEGKMSDRELRRYLILLIIPCVLVVLVIVMLVAGGIRDSVRDTEETASPAVQTVQESSETVPMPVIEPDTKEYFQDFEGSILTKDGSPEVQQLMEQYFKSIADCDIPTFMDLFSSRSTEGEEEFGREFEQQKQYIEGYQNITCYTVPGVRAEDFAAFVYYEVRYAGAETPAPGMVQVYVMRCEDGAMRIYDGGLTPEMEEYLERLSADEDVRLLMEQVDADLEAAMETDEALRDRVNFMKAGAQYTDE